MRTRRHWVPRVCLIWTSDLFYAVYQALLEEGWMSTITDDRSTTQTLGATHNVLKLTKTASIIVDGTGDDVWGVYSPGVGNRVIVDGLVRVNELTDTYFSRAIYSTANDFALTVGTTGVLQGEDGV